MALTPSRMVGLGAPLPSFRLPDTVTGETISGEDSLRGAGLLVMFICNHCPYVVHVRDELTRLTRDYEDRVGIVAINANSLKTHASDGPEHMRRLAEELGWTFPFCFDETQEVARAFDAACTPDFFLYDDEGKLFYRGQLDDSRPGRGEPDGADLRAALDALIAGRPPPSEQKPSIGCNIKWDEV